MKSWTAPPVPALPGTGSVPHVLDTATGTLGPVGPLADAPDTASMYVCGITPYDATHLGHAATYVAFDTLQRVWRDAGLRVRYVQNVTDVDDPLLERAEATGMDWRDLATSQIDLFRDDMTGLRVLPPDDYMGVVETVDLVVGAVEDLLRSGAAYRVDADVYADLAADAHVGDVAHLDRAQALALFAERGGDPDRPGKRDPLDPLLWRGARDGEPSWPGGELGDGRPGWHIECAVIARRYLGIPFSVQGGGEDLTFPHHEMSTSHLRGLTGCAHPAGAFVHVGLLGYDGHKMSKSRGNLVFVSRLRADGVPTGAVRLALLAHHYREGWEYTEADLEAGQDRLVAWRDAVDEHPGGREDADALAALASVRAALADDLDTPSALAALDAWAASGAGGGALIADLADALLGVDLRD